LGLPARSIWGIRDVTVIVPEAPPTISNSFRGDRAMNDSRTDQERQGNSS
jgi:hypothetical protein